MPKRKREKDKDSYDYLLKKIKRLEKKLRSPDRHQHRDSPPPPPAEQAANNNTTGTVITTLFLSAIMV